MQDFRKLRAWNLCQDLAVHVTRIFTAQRCRKVPGFRAQILRAATSPAANLAEGCGKRSNRELARYADIAAGSLSELRSHLDYALRSDMLGKEQFAALDEETDVARGTTVALANAIRRKAEEADMRATEGNSHSVNAEDRLPPTHR